MAVSKRGKKYTAEVWHRGDREWLGTFDTLREAEREEAEGRLEGPSSRVTVKEYGKTWLKLYKRPKESTNLRYRSAVKVFTEDYGNRALSSITRGEAKRWTQAHRGSAGPIKTMFADAVDDEVLRSSPFTGLRVPIGGSNVSCPTAEEVESFLTCESEYMRVAIMLGAFCGLRLGEALGLDWTHLSFTPEGDRLYVERQWTRFGRFDTPKTPSSIRPVAVPERVKQELLHLPRRLDGGALIVNRSGNRYTHDGFRTAWRKISNYRFHDLRHFHATQLVDVGMNPWDVAIQLGHSDGGHNVRTRYGHPSKDVALDRVAMAMAGMSTVTPRQPSPQTQAQSQVSQ